MRMMRGSEDEDDDRGRRRRRSWRSEVEGTRREEGGKGRN